MTERAPLTPATTTTPEQSTKETIPVEDEGQITVEPIAEDESSVSIHCAEQSSPRYATFIVKHPYFLLGLISVLVILSGSLSLIPQFGAPPLPDFTDPILGFEARGTIISDRWRSQANLLFDELRGEVTRVPARCGIKNPIGEQQIEDAPAVCSKEQTFTQGKLTAKLVFAAKNGQNLLTAENLKSICRLEEKIIRSYYNFDKHCHKATDMQHCCPSWSVGYYIALLNGNASCSSIGETEVNKARSLLETCSKFYHNRTLKSDCWNFARNKTASERCDQVPDACTTFNAVYNILHYLTDKHFLLSESDSNPFLRYSLVLVPVKENKDFQVGIYKSRLKDGDVSDGNVVLSGYEMSRLKYEIFNERMIIDLHLAAIAMFFVMIILCLYTRSFVLTSLVGLIVVSSLVIAYFMYTKLLGMKFFPFLNLLTAVLLVGIAADDAFVYVDIWNQSFCERREKLAQPASSREERDQELIHVTAHTMKHASVSMFVTSFTTSSAFLASLTSDITSIRLFGLYAGLSILCMFFLMVTWFPAVVIIVQTVFSPSICCFLFYNKQGETAICRLRIVIDKLAALRHAFFTKHLPRIVIKFRYFFLVFFFVLASGSFVISTVKPGLQLPSSHDLQMFRESHELEKYPLKLKSNFLFETTRRSSFPIKFVWGVKATDTGDQFDPLDMGTLVWDDKFDLASKEAQQWIVSFIRRLKKQSFIAKVQKSSFVEEFFTYMNANCTKKDKMCCKASLFPYNSSIFSECLQRMQCQRIKEIQFGTQLIIDSTPFFDTNGRLRAMFMKVDSTVPFTSSYDPADGFWTKTESWAHKEFNEAPSSASGWVISELSFYNLQKSLSKGTLMSMGISLAVAFGVMLLTTGNVYVSILATFTITCALGVTVGSLVLMGWKLNVLESITLSVAVGLSVDFTLHYGVAYVLALDKSDRKSRVLFSIVSMSSAVTMAAFTTFITGAISCLASVLSYIQTGQFLMIIMSVSWVYATFFFQALCSVLGPENNSGQIVVSKFRTAYNRLKAWRCPAKEDSKDDKKAEFKVLYVKNITENGSVNE